jgi:hypothetical protein
MILNRITIFLILFSFQTNALTQQPRYSLDDLAWLSGCWGWTHNKYERQEYWMKPAGKMMLGMSHTVSREKTIEYEFLYISQADDSSIYYTANPSGQQQMSFKLIKCNPQEAVFENPKHDFPQRIIYRLHKDGSMTARIEGIDNGKEKSIDFPLKRAECD